MKASEVRSQWKETLDKAIAGETIVFDRTGVIFELKACPMTRNSTTTHAYKITGTKPQVITRIDAETFEKAGPIEPIITKKNKDLQFCTHNAVKGMCKKGCK